MSVSKRIPRKDLRKIIAMIHNDMLPREDRKLVLRRMFPEYDAIFTEQMLPALKIPSHPGPKSQQERDLEAQLREVAEQAFEWGYMVRETIDKKTTRGVFVPQDKHDLCPKRKHHGVS